MHMSHSLYIAGKASIENRVTRHMYCITRLGLSLSSLTLRLQFACCYHPFLAHSAASWSWMSPHNRHLRDSPWTSPPHTWARSWCFPACHSQHSNSEIRCHPYTRKLRHDSCQLSCTVPVRMLAQKLTMKQHIFTNWSHYHKLGNFWCSNIFGRPTGIRKLKHENFFDKIFFNLCMRPRAWEAINNHIHLEHTTHKRSHTSFQPHIHF